jgi:hypothetical protein
MTKIMADKTHTENERLSNTKLSEGEGDRGV